MRQKTNHVLIGAFVLTGAAMAVGSAVWLGAGALSRDSLMLETYLSESVTGLEVGAHVRFRGVKIGSVTEIGFTSQIYDSEQPLVLVRFAIQPLGEDQTLGDLGEIVSDRLGEGLRARLATQGLTGTLYLEADLHPNADERYPPLEIDWTPDYRYVPSIPSRIVQISDAAASMLSNLQETDFAGLVEDVRRTLSNVDSAVEAADVSNLAGRAGTLLDQADEALAKITGAAARIETAVTELSATTQARVEAIDPEQLRGLIADARGFASRLEETRRSIDHAISQIGHSAQAVEGTVRTKGRSVDDLLDEAQRLTRNLANLAETLERYPSLLLLGNPPPERQR